MKRIYYGTLPKAHHPREAIDEVFKGLEAQFGEVDGGVYLKYVGPIRQVLGDVKGKTILDLGCGSKASLDDGMFTVKGWEPWGSRALHMLGADVIGVDIASNKDEKFRSLKTDLTQPDSLKDIPDNSVDLAYESMFFDSPAFERICGERAETWNMPGFRSYAVKNILSQLERIVKPEGIFLHTTSLDGDISSVHRFIDRYNAAQEQ